MTMTLTQAHESWSAEIRPLVVAQYGEDDEPAMAESWNDYTDSLCKDGELSDLQYHYCPAWDDAMPDDDRDFILEQMAVTMRATRHNGPRDGWDAGASHWIVSLHRDGKRAAFAYSMGSALTGSPDLCDVLSCLLSDAEAGSQSFEDFCHELGYDSDSRKAEKTWRECQKSAARLERLFTSGELRDLRELFADY